ncbi:DUF4747 family protein [Sphingobacterium oryzagri]|uniref:DUF4747 family protein n=1 Tax=Sphingobacterium oryzagri TaxID=3025669 RepID=A0ABY7WMY5_9SPHI|nr:DUF4747 family protein [Sphingobacterium sp. KACC 22765]WDF68699.1 DUF4747 family protein [Sphingobacterium sp. KACC 22765]
MAKKSTFFILNVKLQNVENNDERSSRYRELISELSNDRHILKVRAKNAAVIMYASYGDSSIPYIYGRIAKGIQLDGQEIEVIKDGNQSTEINDPNSVKLPNVARYIFVPLAHRLCVEKVANGPLPNEVEKYLKDFLVRYLKKDEKIEVILEKDEQTIDRILKAKTVLEINYKISYTNEDIGSAMDTLFDKELKDSKIGQIEVKAKADNDVDGLKINGTPILEGGIKLAESNGEIKRAVIIPKGKTKKETISNEKKPKTIEIEENDNIPFWEQLYKKIMNKYRPNAN